MKIIRIETVQEAMSLLVDQPYDEERKIYRNLYVYRGLPNVEYKLLTSLRTGKTHIQWNALMCI